MLTSALSLSFEAKSILNEVPFYSDHPRHKINYCSCDGLHPYMAECSQNRESAKFASSRFT